MRPEELYIRRAQEYARRVEQSQDFDARKALREMAACWLRLADYAREQREGTLGAPLHDCMAKEGTMSYAKMKRPPLALGFVFPIMLLAITASMASADKAGAAPSAELANKCRDMMIKAYPPVRPGSPHGNAQKERQYFQTCVARNGKMEEPSTVGRGAENPSEDNGK